MFDVEAHDGIDTISRGWHERFVISLDDAMEHARAAGVEIIEGPITRIGATGPILSFYFRDPDCNLIGVANKL